MAGKRYGGPWYGEFRERLRQEQELRRFYPDVRGRVVHQVAYAGYSLTMTVPVPDFGTRRVEVRFPAQSPRSPRVFVDGPDDSPHRYAGDALCIWHPDDPVEQRWVFSDGLLRLVGHVIAHLFREEWWRLTDEWLGPQVRHGQPLEVSPRRRR
jgi:hypothetical protein